MEDTLTIIGITLSAVEITMKAVEIAKKRLEKRKARREKVAKIQALKKRESFKLVQKAAMPVKSGPSGHERDAA
jgi:hypothetical protein